MDNDLIEILAFSRSLVAETRHMRAEHRVTHALLMTESRAAISRSAALLSKGRYGGRPWELADIAEVLEAQVDD